MQTTLPVGTILQGRYLVQGLLGSNPLDAVYLVEDQFVNSDLFNLLVLQEAVNSSKHKLHQIVLEAITLRLLQHQALPRVYQVISADNHDRVYLLMDYIEGASLERLRIQQPEQRFSFPQAMTLMAPIMEAVAYLHRQQPPIIHQNIKPGHILVPTTSDKTVLVKFGISKRYNLDASGKAAPGQVMTGYEAPEQGTHAAITRSDIYALGATFYTLLTGVVPLNASSRTTQMESTGKDPLDVINQVRPPIPSDVAKSIHRALSLSSEDRFANVEQFAQALRFDSTWKLPPVEKREFDLALKTASREHHIPEPSFASSLSMPPKQEEGKPPTEPGAESEEIKFAPEPIQVQPVANPAISSIAPAAIEKQLEGEHLPTAELIMRQEPGVKPQAVQEDPRSVSALTEGSRPLHPSSSLQRGRLVSVLLLVAGISLGTILLTSASRPLARGPTLAQKNAPSFHHPTSGSTTPTPGPAFHLARSYEGTVFNLVANVHSNMFLKGIQQQKNAISGSFSGLSINASFHGRIDASGHIQFKVIDPSGLAAFAFDGSMQASGTFGGNYCHLDQHGQCSGEYGLWSLSPVP